MFTYVMYDTFIYKVHECPETVDELQKRSSEADYRS